MDNKEIKCPKCENTDVVHHGFKITISGGKRQRYMCGKGHTFYFDNNKSEVKRNGK
jgi:transposase-like protein